MAWRSYKYNAKTNKYVYQGVSYEIVSNLITGTNASANGKTFKAFNTKNGSAKNVRHGWRALNPETGRVYLCVAGYEKAWDSKKKKYVNEWPKWKYTHTLNDVKPKLTVSALAVKRSGTRFTASWKLPANASALTSADRATSIKVTWRLSYYADKKGHVERSITSSSTSNVLDINADYMYNKNNRWGASRRTLFFPLTSDYVKSVFVTVALANAAGEGSAVSAALALELPAAPTASNVSFNASNGTFSGTVTPAKSTEKGERYDTLYVVKVTDTSRASGSQSFEATRSSSTTDGNISWSYDAANYQSLVGNQYIKVSIAASSRGLCGHRWMTEKSYVLAFPKPVTIEPGSGKSQRKVKVTSKDSNGKVTIPIAVNKSANSPVDKVKLQVLANVEHAKESEIPGDAEWTDTGSVDDGDCTALIADVADLMPETGKHTWIRVKAWRGSEASVHSYSKVREMRELYKAPPSAVDDECKIASAQAVAGGESVKLVIAYDRKDGSSRDDADGTLVEWSDDKNAWTSTDQPRSFAASWSDKSSQDASFYKTQTVYVKGLDEGTKYYFTARRYKDSDDNVRTLGPISGKVQCTTAGVPSEDGSSSIIAGVAASAPAVMKRGAGLPVEWSSASIAEQDSWSVMSGNKVLLSGRGPDCGCTVPWSRVQGFISGGAVSVFVRVSAGGEFADSPTVLTKYANAPTCSVSVDDLTAQPFGFSVFASSKSCTVEWSVTSHGCVGSSPDGTAYQADGEVVCSGTKSPTMAASGSLYAAQITHPASARFFDGVTYTLWVRVVDGNTGLSSDASESDFTVNWAHKAPAPNGGIEVEVLEEGEVEDEDTGELVEAQDGYTITRGTRISLVAPEGAVDTDVYDLYRVTHDGACLVCAGLPLECSVTDFYAPFGDAGDYAYRVACRTVDGDVEWLDFDYYNDCRVLRFDWGAGQSVELPYDIAVSDSFSKDFELRTHLDGSVEGYWGNGAQRRASLSTTVLRIDEPGQVASVRALGQHAGPVFVRTPDGSAYEANVEVKGLDAKGPALYASFDAIQVGATGAFDVLPPESDESGDEG